MSALAAAVLPHGAVIVADRRMIDGNTLARKSDALKIATVAPRACMTGNGALAVAGASALAVARFLREREALPSGKGWAHDLAIKLNHLRDVLHGNGVLQRADILALGGVDDEGAGTLAAFYASDREIGSTLKPDVMRGRQHIATVAGADRVMEEARDLEGREALLHIASGFAACVRARAGMIFRDGIDPWSAVSSECDAALIDAGGATFLGFDAAGNCTEETMRGVASREVMLDGRSGRPPRVELVD